MTSRQPGTTAPGTARDTGTPGAGPRAAAGQSWTLVLPLTLLILLGLAGLRGTVTAPHWNGPLRHDGVVVGLALEVVLGTLLVITVRRRSAAANAAMGGTPPNDVAAKLRGVLILVLGAGMVAVAAAILIGLHLHAFSKPAPITIPTPPKRHVGKPEFSPPTHTVSFHVSLSAILYGLLVVALLAAVVLSIWWSRWFRPPARVRDDGFVAEDPEDLREAVESGRSALRTIDDARAAIIACYVAMEKSLADRGAARAVADTPDELLARATTSGLVRGTAAARLTALFYEARFSSHPLGPGQRGAAEQALDELAAALAQGDEPAKAGGGP